MARSEMGTLIARNHDEIDQLRKLGERDYLEFTVDRKKPARVGGVNLSLKRTSVKRHRFTLEMAVDDVQVEKKDRTINEPIFFYVNGSRKPYELVVNEVKSDQVKGYLSTPKGASGNRGAFGGNALSELAEGGPVTEGGRVSKPRPAQSNPTLTKAGQRARVRP